LAASGEKASLFDLDGATHDGELMGHRHAARFQVELYRKEVFRKLGDSMIGVTSTVTFVSFPMVSVSPRCS